MAKVGAVMFSIFSKRNVGRMGCRLLSSDNRTEALIHEFNKELEFVFGQPPSAFNSDSQSHGNIAVEEESSSRQLNEKSPVLSHVDAHGKANMVDVSDKPDTKRMAIASCKVLLGEKAFQLVVSNQISKGDVLNVAKIAGICGAKQTSNLIPLCHNIMLSKVHMDLILNSEEHAVEIKGEVTSVGQTGVEMEAMTAVSLAGLTVYDMCKGVSKDIQITNVQLQMKMGGKSSSWVRNQ
ncbi:hypothetical protein SUGI_0512560 [Cryptomeria japonica]|uniref:uncharacterized protein LOC131060631 n=1 Tax=Cryptomeria japonica TaxID=3369 RepID=UPI002408CACE|nr:uncharacterized protein LOC131060631 [Cryptomeria japonica]GLJ26507.1 hypothetical protein SUGI_0512560 [Cryptomeria japonica]